MLPLHHHRRWGAISVGLLVALLVIAPAQAHAGSLDPDTILAALDSDDHRQRQDQTLALLADDALELDTLADLVARARTPEQRHRLLAVAQHHVLRQRREQVFDQPDRGSLGISHRTVAAEDLPTSANHAGPAIEIVLTLPGFPAHGQLEPGDRVIGIAGDPLPREFTADDFRNLIINFRSGDKLQVTVDRQGQQLTRTIQLASAQALGAMYDPNHLQLRPQFERDWQNARQTLQLDDADDLMPLQLRRSSLELD